MEDKLGDRINYNVLIIYLIIMSGSFLQRTFMTDLQKINMFLTIVLIGCAVCKNRYVLRYLKLNVVSIFMVFATLVSGVFMIFSGDIGGVIGYFANLCILYMAWFISQRINFKQFAKKYINVLVIVAIISLVFFYIPTIQTIIPSAHFKNVGTNYYGYRFWGIYAQYENLKYATFNRNIGLFWEPGMYQGYLIFAMVLLSQTKEGKWNLAKFLILMVTVISTGSTTGIILLIPAIFLFVMCYVEKNRLIYSIISGVIVILLSALLVFGQDFEVMINLLLPTDTASKLTDINNISRNTRLYNILSDLKIILKHPLGVINSQIMTLRETSMATFGRGVDASVTNSSLTMCLMYGIVPGILYLFITIKGCFNVANTKMTGIVIALVVLIIMNTEPHYLGIFFTAVLFNCCLINGSSGEKNNTNMRRYKSGKTI